MILSTQATASVADAIAARGRPIWSQLYATNKFEVAKHHVLSMEQQGSIAVAVTVDRSGGRNQEDLRCACGASIPGNARTAMTIPALGGGNRDAPMYRGRRSVRAHEHPVAGA